MQPKQDKLPLWILVAVFAVSGLLALAIRPLGASANLPPRPTASTQKEKDNSGRSKTPVGGWIALSLAPSQSGRWTVVQWQGGDGHWYNVEGWQGRADGDNKIWWVAQKDFGKGPFRWVTFDAQGGTLAATSESFYLPASANQTTWLSVSSKP